MKARRLVSLVAATLVALAPGTWSTITTWYVGSSASCTFNGDGTTKDCAASSNAAGRWRGFSAVNSNAASILAGDTVCFVGDNQAESAALVLKSGSAGLPITYTGDCAGQTARPKLARSSGTSTEFIGTDVSYVKVDFLQFTDSLSTNTEVIKFLATGTNSTDIEVGRVMASNALATAATPLHCIWFTSANGKTFANIDIHDNEVYSCGTAGTQNSDGINIEAVTAGLRVLRNKAHHNYNEGIDISAGGISPRVESNLTYLNGFSGIKVHCGTGAVSGSPVFAGNVTWGNGSWGFVWNDWPNTFFVKNTASGGNVTLPYGPATGNFGAAAIDSPNTGTCARTGNTYQDNIFEADYSAGAVRIYVDTKSVFEAGNPWDGNVLGQTGAQTTLLYFSADTGNNVTISGFSTWATGAHAHDQNAAPAWSGGAARNANGRITRPSALSAAGVATGSYTDVFGRAFVKSVGGVEITSQWQNDVARAAAGTRSAAGTRTAAGSRTAAP